MLLILTLFMYLIYLIELNNLIYVFLIHYLNNFYLHIIKIHLLLMLSKIPIIINLN